MGKIKKFNDFTKEGIIFNRDEEENTDDSGIFNRKRDDIDYTQGGKYREVEPGKFVPSDQAFYVSPDEKLENEINAILDNELDLIDVPFGDGDVEIDSKSKVNASKRIVELLKSKGLI